jgi:membrane fusion protein (multidrug efflux system)
VVIVDKKANIALVEGDQAKQREVTTGLRDGNLVEVSGEGLQEGMAVVTEGAYGLPPETRIRVQP